LKFGSVRSFEVAEVLPVQVLDRWRLSDAVLELHDENQSTDASESEGIEANLIGNSKSSFSLHSLNDEDDDELSLVAENLLRRDLYQDLDVLQDAQEDFDVFLCFVVRHLRFALRQLVLDNLIVEQHHQVRQRVEPLSHDLVICDFSWRNPLIRIKVRQMI
jgi:hypothetical protein